MFLDTRGKWGEDSQPGGGGEEGGHVICSSIVAKIKGRLRRGLYWLEKGGGKGGRGAIYVVEDWIETRLE